MNVQPRQQRAGKRGFTLTELVVGKTIAITLGLLTVAGVQKQREQTGLTRTIQKSRALGSACIAYATDHNGALPVGVSNKPTSWDIAADDENAEAWYNAVPSKLGAKPPGELEDNKALFYSEDYPLYLPEATYPGEKARLVLPYFALGMNALLSRGLPKNARVNLASVMAPQRTVLILERGMPSEEKSSKHQRDFTGEPSAKPQSFICRHKEKGTILFLDGHLEVLRFQEITDANGRIPFRHHCVWTRDMDEDPN